MSLDVAIVGGGIMGAAAAWFIASDPAFDGAVAVIERDPSYRFAATSSTNSCMRQQFSQPLNVEISRFAAAYVKDLSRRTPVIEAPDLAIDSFGYLYLAQTESAAQALRDAHAIQTGLGAATRLLDREELRAAFPYLRVDDILLASHNPIDEGYFDGAALFDAWRRGSRAIGVDWRVGEVVGLERSGRAIEALRLASGERVAVGAVVLAAGTRAPGLAASAGVSLPIEAKKRYTFVFRAQAALEPPLPLTVDPSGAHVRSDGPRFMAGCAAEPDDPVDPADFGFDDGLFETKLWPAIAARVPLFERLKLEASWVGHYDDNTFDRNMILGPHPEIDNFHLMTGFSGHGLQQSPAAGRGVAEKLIHGRYLSLDLEPFSARRILEGRPLIERAVI